MVEDEEWWGDAQLLVTNSVAHGGQNENIEVVLPFLISVMVSTLIFILTSQYYSFHFRFFDRLKRYPYNILIIAY